MKQLRNENVGHIYNLKAWPTVQVLDYSSESKCNLEQITSDLAINVNDINLNTVLSVVGDSS